jgi:hypothetical protein
MSIAGKVRLSDDLSVVVAKKSLLGFAPPALAWVRISHPLLILPDRVAAGRDARRAIYYNSSHVSRAH